MTGEKRQKAKVFQYHYAILPTPPLILRHNIIATKMMRLSFGICIFSYAILVLGGRQLDAIADCPGYRAFNVRSSPHGVVADLTLAGPACNAFGEDILDLTLTVTYETGRYLTTWVRLG